MKRRSLLTTILSGVLFWALIPKQKTGLLFSFLRKPTRPSDHELKTAACIAEIIYPYDKTPGALALGIFDYFKIHFYTTEYYKRHLVALIRITNFLDKEAQKKSGKNFCDAGTQIQKDLIDTLASETINHGIPHVQRDFYTFIDLTMEGCFSDPMHGGNKHGIGWEIMEDCIKVEWFDA